MKVKVTNDFIDIHTGDLHKAGDIIEVSNKRLNEIKAAGDFVETFSETKVTKKDKK